MTTHASSAALAMDLLEDAAEGASSGLAGRVLGLVGLGALGCEIARRAAARGMEVLYCDLEPGAGPQRRVLLGELLERSDFVMPIADGASLSALRPRLKPGAALIDYLGYIASAL
jgi:phosphoglycerate dehydrogenase-like enzyme